MWKYFVCAGIFPYLDNSHSLIQRQQYLHSWIFDILPARITDRVQIYTANPIARPNLCPAKDRA
jgi:hypothetical protein